MNDTAQIKTQLKSLKLSGCNDNLELRLLEAQQNQLAHSEFLSMILTDEIENRQMRKVKRLLVQSGMGSEKTLESFDFSFNHSINLVNSQTFGHDFTKDSDSISLNFRTPFH